MKKFNPDYVLLKEMYQDEYYPDFLVDKVKTEITKVIELLESGESDVETFDINAEFLHFLNNAVNITSPACTRTIGIINFELHTVFEVDGVSHDCICSVRTDFAYNAFIDSSRKYIASIIIGMFSNEVDTSWSSINVSSLTVEVFDETASYKFYVHGFNILGLY